MSPTSRICGSMGNSKSPRQELGDYANSGQLRTALEKTNPTMSEAARSLCVDVVLRYCEPRRKR